MADIVEEFFSREYENKINKDILFYTFPKEEVKAYVEELINEPIPRFLGYLDQLSEKERIISGDVFQFSSFDDATINFCKKVEEENNPGMKFLEIGQLLLDNDKERKDAAYVKYGENHAKTAELLGLAFELYHTYYLSGVGYIFAEISEENQKKLMERLIIRNKLITRTYQASKNGTLNMREFLYMLSDSTYFRRRSNIRKVFNVLVESTEYDFKKFVKLINL